MMNKHDQWSAAENRTKFLFVAHAPPNLIISAHIGEFFLFLSLPIEKAHSNRLLCRSHASRAKWFVSRSNIHIFWSTDCVERCAQTPRQMLVVRRIGFANWRSILATVCGLSRISFGECFPYALENIDTKCAKFRRIIDLFNLHWAASMLKPGCVSVCVYGSLTMDDKQKYMLIDWKLHSQIVFCLSVKCVQIEAHGLRLCCLRQLK